MDVPTNTNTAVRCATSASLADISVSDKQLELKEEDWAWSLNCYETEFFESDGYLLDSYL